MFRLKNVHMLGNEHGQLAENTIYAELYDEEDKIVISATLSFILGAIKDRGYKVEGITVKKGVSFFDGKSSMVIMDMFPQTREYLETFDTVPPLPGLPVAAHETPRDLRMKTLDGRLPVDTSKMTWVTNIDSEDHFEWQLRGFFIGEPSSSEVYTVEEMKKMNMVGVYKSDQPILSQVEVLQHLGSN